MFRTIRNHWKKSLFAFCAISYGAKWSYDRYKANEIRQFYCQQASLYGSQTIPSMTRLNRIAVLLNGKANNGKAKSIYDKTIYPLLNLTGLDVRVFRVDTNTNLQELLSDKIEPNQLSALMIIGGDGTLSELAPYIFQSNILENLPICIVPIGENTSFARSLFSITNKNKLYNDVSLLCETVLALFNGKIVRKPLLKITMNNTNHEPIYASSLNFGHYSRLEQLQKRLWYFSYLKYPISSIYLYITNSLKSILPSEDSTIIYSNPCTGCLRCQPSLNDQYQLLQQQKEQKKASFFSRIYQSNRSNIKPINSPISPPIENPDCGIEYCINTNKKPIQIWANIIEDEHDFQIDISDKFERFNYDKNLYPKQSIKVQHIRFNPNNDLIKKHFLINHEKFDLIKEENNDNDNDENRLIECQIELSEKKLKFLQINNEFLLEKKSILKPTINELEEDILDKKGIFLFSKRHQHIQT